MRIRSVVSAALAFFTIVSCNNDHPAVVDSGTPTVDSGVTSCTSMIGSLGFTHRTIGVVPGSSRHTYLEGEADAHADLVVNLTSSTAGIIDFPASVTIPANHSRVQVRVTGTTVGTTMLHAVTVTPSPCMTDIEVVVTTPTLPACAGSATGMVTPGGAPISVATGTTLAGSSVSVPTGASRADTYHVDPFMVSIGCHADQLPSGYVALGPAVTFQSDSAYRFNREIDFAIPIELSLLPSDAHRGHVEVAYTGPGVSAARAVGIATPAFEGSAGGGMLRFQAPRLGTYQAVVRSDVPHMVSRTFHHRGIMGFSMGGSGSGRIGLGHPELFDFVAPLGGPTDWIYLLEYIHRYHIGGFCTDAERTADPTGCGVAALAHAPNRGELYEHTQHFENWWYEDGYDGQGGHFNREDYISIFRDLTAMFGNANTDTSDSPTAPDLTPPGIPDSTRAMSDTDRCMPANLAMLAIHGEPAGGDTNVATGFFDDEYNPAGHYDVIPFCDGAERLDFDADTRGHCTSTTTHCEHDTGNWDPAGVQTTPMEVALAVDINGNHLRDAGEPIIRNGHEPFADTGCDGALSAAETGFNAITNPDPAGDDYDFQYNPNGTEGNWERDDCGAGVGSEHYDDVGLDGVAGTPQVGAGGYDHGEGNGHFDIAAGADRMIGTSPRGRVRGYRGNLDTVHAGYPLTTIDGFDFFADGGVRDLFNWAVQGHHTLGGFAARGIPVRYYNGHAGLHLDGRDTFTFNEVPWEETGRYTLVRYGSIDATEDQKIAGDGGHVGTPNQLLYRFFSSVGMMSARWPNMDRTIVNDRVCTAITPACEHINSITQNFTAPTTGRTGQVTIVLPPGYFAPENATVQYPIVYFLHGYGMAPMDLQAIGNIMWNYMVSQSIPEARRVPKMIFVFPDGRCQGTECLRGTFYTDAPASTPNGAQMQQFLLDLDAHMHTTYRVRGDETVTVAE